MFKYLIPFIIFFLIIIPPYRDLRDDNLCLSEQLFYVELELSTKNKTIDSLNIVIKTLNDTLTSKKTKPNIKKRTTLKIDTTTNIIVTPIKTDTL
jgi:hypothetical protein